MRRVTVPRPRIKNLVVACPFAIAAIEPEKHDVRTMAGPGGLLFGRIVLIVEDSFLVARDLRATVEWAGAVVVGPVARRDKALALISAEHLDAAVVDVSLDPEGSLAIAEALTAHHIPYLIVSGFPREELPVGMHRAPYLSKPVEPGELVEAIARFSPTTRIIAGGTPSPTG